MLETLVLNNACIYTPSEIIQNGCVLIENGIIKAISLQPLNGRYNSIDCKGKWLLPGFIDIHVNGGGGGMSIDGTRESIEKIVTAHAKYGTTGMLITTISVEDSLLEQSIVNITEVINGNVAGAKVLGIHLEGPFLSNGKRGAHQKQFLKKPDMELFNKINAIAKGHIKILSLAPELENAFDVIQQACKKDVIVGFAHSEADFNTTRKAIDSGMRLCTHLFNGMAPLSHKEPGPVGAFLTTQETYVEIISDGIHIAPPIMEIIYKSKSKQEIVIVTDAVTPAATDMKTFEILGVELEVRDNSCYMPNTDNLAGSALTMNKAVKIFNSHTSSTLLDAINMASLNPARLLKIDNKKGSIEVGKDADLILTDADLNVSLTIVEGKVVFKE